MLGLHCCTWSFFSCSEWGLLSRSWVRASHCSGFSGCRVWAPGHPGINSCPPGHVESFLSRSWTHVPYTSSGSLPTGPPGKSLSKPPYFYIPHLMGALLNFPASVLMGFCSLCRWTPGLKVARTRAEGKGFSAWRKGQGGLVLLLPPFSNSKLPLCPPQFPEPEFQRHKNIVSFLTCVAFSDIITTYVQTFLSALRGNSLFDIIISNCGMASDWGWIPQLCLPQVRLVLSFYFFISNLI